MASKSIAKSGSSEAEIVGKTPSSSTRYLDLFLGLKDGVTANRAFLVLFGVFVSPWPLMPGCSGGASNASSCQWSAFPAGRIPYFSYSAELMGVDIRESD